jgi:hypothetical protein
MARAASAGSFTWTSRFVALRGTLLLCVDLDDWNERVAPKWTLGRPTSPGGVVLGSCWARSSGN